LLVFTSFRRALFGDGSLRKLGKISQGAGNGCSQTILSGFDAKPKMHSLLDVIRPFGKVERFLDAKERNYYEG
jgi:hypothetical protein